MWRRRVFLFEHFCQGLFITFVEEWYLKWQIETKKFDHFLNCLKSTKDTTWKKNDFKEHGNWYKTFPGADWNKKIARIPYPEQKPAIDCLKTRPNAHHMSKTGLFEWVCEWVTGPKTRGDTHLKLFWKNFQIEMVRNHTREARTLSNI